MKSKAVLHDDVVCMGGWPLRGKRAKGDSAVAWLPTGVHRAKEACRDSMEDLMHEMVRYGLWLWLCRVLHGTPIKGCNVIAPAAGLYGLAGRWDELWSLPTVHAVHNP